MPSNEPEIVTRDQAISLRKIWSDVPDSVMHKLADTIELFAGLLEEPCECGHKEARNYTECESCQRKAAALRRYRGE